MHHAAPVGILVGPTAEGFVLLREGCRALLWLVSRLCVCLRTPPGVGPASWVVGAACVYCYMGCTLSHALFSFSCRAPDVECLFPSFCAASEPGCCPAACERDVLIYQCSCPGGVRPARVCNTHVAPVRLCGCVCGHPGTWCRRVVYSCISIWFDNLSPM